MTPPLPISEVQKRIKRIVSQKRFNRFADRLGEVITELWLMAGDDVLEHIAGFLKGTRKFTLKDFEEIDEIAQQSMRTAFGTNLNPVVQQASIAAYSKGLDEVRAGLSKSFSLVDQQAVSFIHEHHMYWSLKHYSTSTTERIKRLSETVIKNGLSRADAGKFFTNTLGTELKRDAAYWELMADAITTRSRSFSNISAFEQAGVERYVVSIVNDHRTSDICLYLDGQEVTTVDKDGNETVHQLDDREFLVSDAAEVRDRMIAAETPEEAKEIMPWLSPKDVLGKSVDALASGGVISPPFHGNCRSRLVIA